MGIIDSYKNWKQSRQAKKIAKAEKLVKNPKAMKEDRWAALDFLSELRQADLCVGPLLQRFEYSLEHGINDTREKELAFKGIVNCGVEAIPKLREHLEATSRIAWPIKVLREVGEDSMVVETLMAVLNFGEVSFDPNAVEKNYDILCYLRDYPIASDREKLAHFLQDSDERVRHAAVEVMIEQGDNNLAPAMESFLGDTSSENRRVRQAVIEAYLNHNWKMSDPKIFVAEPRESIFVDQQGYLKRRA